MGRWIDVFLASMVLIFLFNSATKGQVNRKLELDSNKISNSRQYYRLATYEFCHGDSFHLIANLLIMRNILYPFFQNKLTSLEFIFLFLISSIITGVMLLSHYSGEFTFVGSSVGFYSFFGLMTTYYIHQGFDRFIADINRQPFYNNLLVWALLIFFLGNLITMHWEKYKSFSGVYAHTISWAVGLLSGFFMDIGK